MMSPNLELPCSRLQRNSACQSHCRPYQPESRMRENRLSGSEGGAILKQSSLPLSFTLSLWDNHPIHPRSRRSRSFPALPALPICHETPPYPVLRPNSGRLLELLELLLFPIHERSPSRANHEQQPLWPR